MSRMRTVESLWGRVVVVVVVVIVVVVIVVVVVVVVIIIIITQEVHRGTSADALARCRGRTTAPTKKRGPKIGPRMPDTESTNSISRIAYEQRAFHFRIDHSIYNYTIRFMNGPTITAMYSLEFGFAAITCCSRRINRPFLAI